MGRPPRIDPESGWHHVMNRGAARRDVFTGARDGHQFLHLVGEGCAISDVEVHAYCLMNNHFHLLLHCPGGGLSAFMQRVSSMYTRFRNDRIGADGPIFRGRFRSLAVDSSDYLDFAGRYIHRNPLDVRPPVALDTFRWSSYRYYVTRAEPPDWLRVDYLRDAHQGSAGYRTFVEGDRADAPAPISWAIDTAVAEFDDADTATRQLRRAVGVAMLQRATGSTQERLEQWLAFPTDDARRMALNRSERRLANWSALAAIADRAIDLAA